MGYKFQFVTLAGFHALNYRMYTLAQEYKERHGGVLEAAERSSRGEDGYTATKHQREVGTGYFDRGGRGDRRREVVDAGAGRAHRDGSSLSR